MASLNSPLPLQRHDLRMAWIVVRREVQDSFRDWRIIIPILILTLAFPLLANFTAQRMLGFTEQYGAELIGNRLIPFLLLVVGFFPMSFSLVIALETFVGEKERKSLEPLLATPLTDTQLYLGKALAALIPPLLASFLGMTVYLAGLTIIVGWMVSWELLIQIYLLTALQGLVMVSGAVVISSQTTSTRAANLLASFVIIPMALLLQVEAVIMFWGRHTGHLWWIAAGLAVTALILIRMGIHLFNREELLGRDIDHIRLGWVWRQFWERFSGREGGDHYPTLWGWYRQTAASVSLLKRPALVVLIAMAGSIMAGIHLSQAMPFPPPLQEQLSQSQIADNVQAAQELLARLPAFIFLHNLRAIALATLLGLFSFGVMAVVIFMLPWGVIGYVTAQLAMMGENPLLFLMVTVAPHGLFELPAILLVASAALRWHAIIIAPPRERLVSESWLRAAADFGRIFIGLVIPLLAVAALVETYITPLILIWAYG